MPTPRENTSVVKAPVLFRLPHLQRAAEATAVAASTRGDSGHQGSHSISSETTATPAIATNRGRGTTFIDRSSETVEPTESSATTKSTTVPAKPESAASTTDESFMSRWGFEIKRSVILLAAMALLWGAWAMGQKSATSPIESNLAGIGEPQSASDSASVAAIKDTSGPLAETSDIPQVAQIVEPKLSSSSGSSSGFDPVTEPEPSYYGGEDLGDHAVSSVAKNDVESDFSRLPFDALESPSNDEFYNDFGLGEPGQSSAQKPPLTNDVTVSNQLALNQPTLSSATETSLPSATNFVASATPEMPGFDPNNVGKIAESAPVDRPVLSSTPNGIIDWSRYLPGAGGSGAIRAVSATQAMGETPGNTESLDTQAIYLDKNDAQAPNVGVAPFYR